MSIGSALQKKPIGLILVCVATCSFTFVDELHQKTFSIVIMLLICWIYFQGPKKSTDEQSYTYDC
jgi:uncharacterized membrane protein YbaN (DUF454 family)